MSVSEPGKIITPWAESGLKNTIPPAANPATGRAGFDQGFSAINMTAKEAGGIPPFGQDFNGIFYEVTNILRYMQAGGQPTFDASLATAIGGYPKGAMVLGSDGVTLWQSQIESNSADPDIDPSNWGTFDIGLKAQLAAPGGASLVGPGTISRDNDKFSILQGRPGEDFGPDITRGLGVHLADPITGVIDGANVAKFNYFQIDSDQVNVIDDAKPGTKVDGLMVIHNFGTSNAKGGRHAAELVLNQFSPTSSTNTDRNYVGVAGVSKTIQGDGGTPSASPSTWKGGYFGGNFVGNVLPGAQGVTNVSGCEFNSAAYAGSTVWYRSGIQVIGGGDVQGQNVDIGVAISNLPSATVRWRTGIRMGNMNGQYALGPSSSVMIAQSDGDVANGVILPKCSEKVFESGDVLLENTRLTLGAANSGIELGSTSVPSTVYIDGHSSGNVNDYDARMSFIGGSATTGAGTWSIAAATVRLDASLVIHFGSTQRPLIDNTYDYGAAGFRGRTAYFGTGAINTSDAREKAAPLAITDTVLDAWGDVQLITFQWLDAIRQKGEDVARWHFGVIAQQVRDAFAARGLDGCRYGLLCYDEWEATPETTAIVPAVLDEDSNIITPERVEVTQDAMPAGNRWGIRPDQCLFLEAAYQRRRCDRIEARLSKAGL